MTDPVPQGAEFKQSWRRLSLSERLRIRWAVSRGRTVKDPRHAALAAGLARHWLESLWLRPAGIALQLLMVAVLLVGFWFLVPPDRRWSLFTGLFIGLGVALSAPQVYRQAERANREVAEGGRPAQSTASGLFRWTPGMSGRRFRHQHRGYKIDEVDDFFGRIESGTVSAKEIEDVTFRLTWWRAGYDLREVDEALDQAKDVARPE
jgi:DivIVA domain-containing protein